MYKNVLKWNNKQNENETQVTHIAKRTTIFLYHINGFNSNACNIYTNNKNRKN